ncbi:competence type IV pilus minor pilin ComGF [Falsibacillus albus]|uniref:competence type IV pilus minor pilin ComGF n=1 Tax=Falsibacillus albus TaxID=2478915 RepID=UPI001314EDB9|nr:competence type IV pilus minor pilin ComGF [Falsibacillus albus]
MKKLSRNNGFTLLEALFILLIFSFMVAFVPLIVSSYQKINQYDPSTIFEWELFLVQLRNEIKESADISLSSGTLSLTTAKGTVQYEKYSDVIRRRINYQGHEVVLQNIKNIEFTLNQNELLMKVQFQNQKKREASFIVFQGNPTVVASGLE